FPEAFANDALSKEQAARELERLEKLWQSHIDEIQTARIEADHFQCHLGGNWGDQNVDAFVTKLDNAMRVDAENADLKSVTKQIAPSKRAWRKLLFIKDGQHRRARDTWNDGEGG